MNELSGSRILITGGAGFVGSHIADQLIGQEGVREVILAMNPTAQGEATAHFLSGLLAEQGIAVTRIARGVPMGSEIELADSATLVRALEGRKKL